MFREFVIAKRKQTEAHEHSKWVVWHTAALSRSDYKLTTFDQFMRGGRPQTPQQQAAMWRDIAESWGLKSRKFSPKRSRVIRARKAHGQ